MTRPVRTARLRLRSGPVKLTDPRRPLPEGGTVPGGPLASDGFPCIPAVR